MERIQKILAHGGIASRRAAEQLIKAGRVRVNGRVITELGTKADPRRDKVEVDGKRVVAEDHVYIVLHKPRGVVATMNDPEGRPTVRELLGAIAERVYPVGRLDFATSGVLLATNDGELADGLLHPRKTVPKTYVLKVKGVMKPADVELWSKGVRLEDGMTLPADAKLLRHETDKTWLELTIREGRNQQIRRMGEATGFPVMRLARLAFAQISVDGLAPGRWRHLTRDELQELKKTYGVPRTIPSAMPENPTRSTQRQAVMPTARRGLNDRVTEGRPQRAFGSEATAAPRASRSSAVGEEWPRSRGRGVGSAVVDERGSEGRSRPQNPRARNENARAEGSAAGAQDKRARIEGGASDGSSSARGGSSSAGRGGSSSAGRGGSSSRTGRGSASGASSPSTSPRYGGGSPGRRSYEVTDDWGGGAARGSTRTGGDRAGGSGGEAASGTDQPRADVGGGRSGRSRTTGTGGGIGAREDASRVKGRRGQK